MVTTTALVETRQPEDSSARGDWLRPPRIEVARQWRTVDGAGGEAARG